MKKTGIILSGGDSSSAPLAGAAPRACRSGSGADLSFIDRLKEGQVYGYGLVVGLQGTGDTKKSRHRPEPSLQNLLKNLGMEGDDVTSANTATAVLVTGQASPAFVRVGDRIDVTVSSIGDAKSLEGGILVQTPCGARTTSIYAAAQGNALRCTNPGAAGGYGANQAQRCGPSPW
ncbi:MAG: flagellar basal body P-ring protein FlgI [Desulfomicrobium escambiense]|nr:flagellar basal body P-ring protein FlgI [Desulfomicrobium escambiense]